ncbi:MAG: 4Fe-4S dicluster domain-containing protein [Candidatus Schekmanbacteria bacterium]|nr:4Fe-4S dicluster domain-containing protein [Candidatus Schekmanbacteria bacterium]
MPRWGMVIDLDKCTGCGACIIACNSENNIGLSDPQLFREGRSIRWMDILTIEEGEYPDVKKKIMPRPCFHCDKPPCTKVCPVRATYKGDGGLVGQIYPRCIGCRYCTTACPYTVRYFDWYVPYWPSEMMATLNPDVSVRPKGVVEKCSFCHHRWQKAKELARSENRDMREDDYVPACVESCPGKAMYFGDLDNPQHRVTVLSKSRRASRLLEDLGTEPKVYYLLKGE